jgi:hypothetical protein
MTAVDGGEGVSNNSDPLSLYRLAPVKKFWQWEFLAWWLVCRD